MSYEPSSADKASDLLTEQSVVGGVLLGGQRALGDVLDVLAPGDFYWPKHEFIVRAASALARRGEPVDVLTVSDELERTGMSSKAGGTVYLHEVSGVTPTAANVGYYADMVLKRAVKRRMVAAGTRITEMGKATEGDVFELVEIARAEVDNVTQHARVDVHPIGDTIDAVIEGLDTKPEFISTSFESLDKIIGGLAPGNLVILGARPGEGKTILGMQLAVALARLGSVAFCSLEMSEADLQKRLLAQFGEIHMQNLRNHTLNAEQKRRLIVAKQRFQQAPIYINDSGTSLSQIRSHIRSVARRGKLTGVVIDYLQLMTSTEKAENRQLEVGSFSRSLKLLSKELHVPIIALSQLKRSPEGPGGRKQPTLQDLRESGSLEQDADVVLLLSYNRAKKPHDVDVIVAKNRHGEMGKVTLEWQGQFARMRDRAWSPFGSVPLDMEEAS